MQVLDINGIYQITRIYSIIGNIFLFYPCTFSSIFCTLYSFKYLYELK